MANTPGPAGYPPPDQSVVKRSAPAVTYHCNTSVDIAMSVYVALGFNLIVSDV